MEELLELLRQTARLEGENDAYRRIIKELTTLSEPPVKQPVSLDPFVWLGRGINAGLDQFENLVKRLVSEIMR